MIDVLCSRGTQTQIYIKPPSSFMLEHQQQLLPTWQVPINYVILVLQQSRVTLKSSSVDVIQEKDYLREQFWRLGCNLIFQLRDRNYLSDLFDPRSGYPWLTPAGQITLNDNAVVEASLGFTVTNYGNCSLLSHPQWHHAVYPSTMVTTAPLTVIKSVLQQQLEIQKEER